MAKASTLFGRWPFLFLQRTMGDCRLTVPHSDKEVSYANKLYHISSRRVRGISFFC